jgi:glycopeptide antibiotics resistance protein
VLGFTYRTIDIDDVLLNAIGIAVGWLAVRIAFRARERAIAWWDPEVYGRRVTTDAFTTRPIPGPRHRLE